MVDLEVHSRPLLFDRIQVLVMPDYYRSDYFNNPTEYNSDFKEYYKDIISKNKEFGFKKRVFTDKKGKSHYQVILPEEDSDSFISNVIVDAFHPFCVYFKLNFIRLLRSYLSDEEGFRSDYDKLICLDEDNYLNYENWPYWNNKFVYDIINDLNDICIDIAHKSMCRFLPFHKLFYEKVVVQQIETNIDYYVGCSNSLNAIDKIVGFIDSIDGREFRKDLGEISLKHFSPDIDFDKSTKRVKNQSDSIQFGISRGLDFKVYRKTTDHIRCELPFMKDYIRRKFKEVDKLDKKRIKSSLNIKRILKPVMEFSKDFFKEVDFENTIYDVLSCNSNTVVVNQLEVIHDFNRDCFPGLNNIYDSILNNMPISDSNTVRFISKYPKIKRCFIREYNQYGKYVYVYDPVKS